MAKRRKQKSTRAAAPSRKAGRKPAAAAATAVEEAPAPEEAAAPEPTGEKPRSWKRTLGITSLLLLLLVAAGFAAHGFCLKNPFYLDDQAHILKSARIHTDDWFYNGFRLPSYIVWNWLHDTYTFKNPAAFHAVNLILHILVAFATFLAGREFTRLDDVKRLIAKTPVANSLPFLAALIFAVHTIGSETVNYASQTSIQFVTLFLMLSAAAFFRWVQSRNWLWLAVALVAVALSAISKKPGVWHALVNLFIVAIVFWKGLFHAPKDKLQRWIPVALIAVALVGTWFFIRKFGLYYYVLRLFNDPEMKWHVLTQSRVFWEYIWRLFLPVRLCSDHWIPITQSTGDVVSWAGLTAIVLLLGFNAWLLIRGKRVYCVLLALTLAPLVIRFFFRNQEPFVEYRTYPTLPWFAMLTVLVAGALLFRRVKPAHFAIGTTVVALVLAGLSTKRSMTWNDPIKLVGSIRNQYPLHVRSQSYVQAIDFSKRRYHAIVDRQKQVRRQMQAIFEHNRENKHRKYIIARSLNSFMFCEQYNAYALIELKRPQQAIDRVTEVLTTLSKAVGTDRGKAFAVLYRVRGKAHAALRQFDQAAADYSMALERMPDDLETPRLVKRLPPQFQAAAQPKRTDY